MPVTFEKDKNGRVRAQGSWTDSGTPAPATTAKPKPQGFNPFAEIGKQIKRGVNAADNAIRYEQKRYAQDPGKRYREVTGRLTNDARYELKQLSTPGGAVRSVRRAVSTVSGGGGNPVLGLISTKAEPLVTSAAADIVRNVVELGQKAGGRKRADYVVNPIGRWTDRAEDKAYAKYGWTPRQEQEGATRLGTELGIGAAQAGIAGIAAGGLGVAASKLPVVGNAIGRGGAAFARLLDPTKAKTFMGGLAKTAAAGGIEEGLSTPFQDNTGGGVMSLLNAVLDTEFDDPVEPEMDRVEAMQAALPGNIAAGVALPLALGAIAGGAFKGIARSRRAQAEVRPIAEARDALVSGRVLEEDPVTGTSRFTDEVLNQPKPAAPEAPPANFKEAREQARAEKAAAKATPAPEGAAPAPSPDPWETPAAEAQAFPEGGGQGLEPDPWKTDEAKPLEAPEPDAEPFDPFAYDPETTFEADVFLSQTRELSHEELLRLYQLDPTEPVTFNLEQALGARTPVELGEQVNWENVSAPKENLSQRWLSEKYPTLLNAAEGETLRGLFRNSPELAAMARSLTGRGLSQLTKQDMVMVLLQHPERALLPGRLENPFENVWDLSVKPDEYQFKQNVDERGVQANNSLFGVKTWDPDAEGTLEVRRVPETGDLDMVNGHNRLALARELGIPSVPTKYMRTETAAQAREMGAISNISSGGGTVWDAAKFLRENPSLDTMAKLKADGKPGKSGLWRDGLALSKLPEDLFKAAQDGVIDSKYAVLIGNSGLDEVKMRTLFRKATTEPTVASMQAYIEIARAAGTGEVDQGVLFGGGAEDLTDQLADLYSDLQRSIGDDKALFGRVSRGAEKLRSMTESTVDVAGSIQISEGARQAQRFVKDNWVSNPDLSKAMQDGAMAIKNGASKASVVREIKQALPGMLDDAMSGGGGGRALTFEEGDVQGSLLEPAAASPEGGSAPLFDIPDDSLDQAPPDAPGTPQFKAAPALIERWEKWTPEKQDQVAMQSNKALLSEQQVANREAKVAAADAGGEGADLKAIDALEEHQAAIEYLDWYDNRIAKRGPEPGQREAMELELVRRGIANGELRPPDLAIPEIDGPQGVDLPGAIAELASGKPGDLLAHASDEELRLRAAQAQQDLEMETAMLDAEREATGFYEAPTEALIPEILEELPPVESTSIADMFQAVNQQMLESDRRTFRAAGQALDVASKAVDELAAEGPGALPPAKPPTIKSRTRWSDLEHLPEGHPERITWIRGAVRQAQQARDLDFVKSWASMKAGAVTGQLLQKFSRDMLDAVNEGIRVSGIDPERFRLVKDVDTTKMFGRDNAIESMSGWNQGGPEAEILRADPNGAEADYLLEGRSTGLYVYEPGMATLSDTVHVSLSLALDNLAEVRAGVRKTIGSDVHRTAYHEAFHRLQVQALTIDELNVMGSSESRARMETIIKQGGGEWSDSMRTGGMDGQMELEAEAFAVWAAQKRVRLQGGKLDAIYERLNDLTKVVRRKIRALSGKNPAQDLMDVFDMAYRGEVGKRSPSDLKNLAETADVELMTLVPRLKESINEAISSKLAEARVKGERLMAELTNGGCT